MIMKKNVFVIVLLVMMLAVAGCSEITGDKVSKESTIPKSDLTDGVPQRTAKEEYLNDIEAVMGLSVYLEEAEGDMDSILSEVKKVQLCSKEGKQVRNTYIKILDLSKEGIELVERANENNYEEILKKSYELQIQIEDLMETTLEEQLDDLLVAAKKAGVQAEDLQERGLY